MPELPEVQTVVDDLNAEQIAGHAIVDVSVHWPRIVALEQPDDFSRKLKGCRIQRAWRRGKFIVFDLKGGGGLLFHLRMTGRLYLRKRYARRQAHEHLRIRLDDGRRLVFYDTRKFGRACRVADTDQILGKLGPEPLSGAFTAQILGERLSSRRRQVKALLLDQTVVAGLGNIYVDEALWSAKIHPLRHGSSLNGSETRALHRAIRRVLRQGLRNAGTSLGNGKSNFVSPRWVKGRNRSALKVFRRTGKTCPRCGFVIRRIIVSQRSTHICTRCQHFSSVLG
jgi:formamidopyrimidine-DNA glycosylase